MPAPKDSMKRDVEVNHRLNLLGFHVFQIWESDIKHNTQESTMRILNMIKNKEVVNRMWFG